ncbi:fanconi-associated nuclease 1-like [Centruroides sculpturatus]|uniref:fanconi-associated nuclease 1-like n=1 Tax=Centruroides sculpturatus TaxID=218467 RepID=UPI000C6ED159|nr:fanconi-associated nuclease 1-like [Centruroides sculpturatus]XP_023234893.1 fanconi-associated nuclease 1-like [Centruroides sculpturatus]XP_023234894.1 fanconi-associated nuclease 1-like [Centruroides sculpturatus]XP_023234895.1 fanconi-associated nuclease 1-like [Centruroides sculpturatus]
MSILQFFKKKKNEVSEFSCTSSNTNSSKSSCYFVAHKYSSTVEHDDDDDGLGEAMTLSLSSRLKLKRIRSSEAINVSKEKKIYNEIEKETSLVSEENKIFANNLLKKNMCNSENVTEENTAMRKHSELENSPVNKNDNHEMDNIPYYLKNFKYILDCVFQNEDYARLFNEEDQIIIQKFNSLSDPEQKLFVRLFQRKNKWFRSSKLDYSEIATNIKAVLHNLYINNFLLDVKNIDDVECALNLLTIPELRNLCKMFQIKLFQKGKKEMIATLIKQGRQNRSIFSFGDITNVLLKRAKSIAGDCYKLYPEAREVFIRVMILFSLTSLIENEDEPGGGLQQQLYTLLMVNTGKIVFPAYKISQKTTLFQTRNDLIMYVNAKHLESEILQKMENKKFEDAFQLFNKAKEDYNHYSSQMKNERYSKYLTDKIHIS